jgi:iron complex outermembrane receptor protein
MARYGAYALLFGVSSVALTSTALAQPAQRDTTQTQSSAPTAADAPPESTPASANPSGDAEIIVTAERRSVNLQNAPFQATVATADALTGANIRTVFDLPRLAPEMRIGTSPGTVGQRVNIRGLGSFGNSAIEPSVATFVDGIYIPRPSSLSSSLLDVEAIEILSGPQGTLFGRNASVGAINIRTAGPAPGTFGSVSVEGGTGARYRAEGVLNLTVSDAVGIRAAGIFENFGGYWTNDQTRHRFGGLDTRAVRVTARFALSPSLTWLVRGDYAKYQGEQTYNFAILGDTVGPRLAQLNAALGPADLNAFDGHDNQYNQDFDVNDHHWGVSSDLTLDLGSGFSTRLIDSYRDYQADEQDGDLLGFLTPVLGRNIHYRSKSNSHELQLLSPRDTLLNGRFDFVAGLFYLNEDFSLFNDTRLLANFCTQIIGRAAPALVPACNTGPFLPGATAHFSQDTESYAAYAQARLGILSTVDLTVGLRYTHESKDGRYVGVQINPASSVLQANENTTLNYDQGKLTGRANLAWRPTSNLMLYATYSTGFKSGGFNSSAATIVLGQNRLFRPETVTNYEAGFRFRTTDRTLTLNGTAFHMLVHGFQERATNGVISTIRNVGNIEDNGFSLTAIVRPVANFTVNAGVTYLDAQFTSYPGAPAPVYIGGFQDLTGARPTYAPKFSGNVGAELEGTFGGDGWGWAARGDVTFVSRQNIGTVVDNSALTFQSAYELVGARFTIHGPEDRWSFAIAGDNLFDVNYCNGKGYQGFEGLLGLRYPGGTTIRCFVAPPRTFSARATMRF